MMDAIAKVVVAVSICAFITRINYDSLNATQWQPPAVDRAFSLDVRVSCDDNQYDMAILTPSELAMVEKAVEDSFNRVYLGPYGDYLSYVGWKGSKVSADSRDGRVVNLFQATMIHSGNKAPPESFMIEKLHLDWELAFRELVAPLNLGRRTYHLDIVDARDKRLRAHQSTFPPRFSPPSRASSGEERRID